MSVAELPPRLLLYELFHFLILSLKLLDSLIVIVDSCTKDLLGPFLPNHELIQVIFQHPRSNSGSADNAGSS